jgi:uncharacterized protein YjbJ (UPF0337 family)
MADDKGGMFDSLLGKAEDALGKFADDPEKVAKARAKADELLGKHMSQEQADQLTGKAEELLHNYGHKHDETNG